MLLRNRRIVPPALVLAIAAGFGWLGAQGQQPPRESQRRTQRSKGDKVPPRGTTQEPERVPVSLAGGSDATPPRIASVSPTPQDWVVDNAGVNEVRIGFDETVTVPPGSISAWTVTGGVVGGLSTTFNATTNTLTVTFPAPIRDDRLTLAVDFSVVDLGGNELDGEIADPGAPILPSGDGVRGGQAVFRFNILQGDANREGVVNATDGTLLVLSLGRCSGDVGFDPQADLNVDGCVNALDVATFSLAKGRSFPTTTGSVPTVTQVRRKDGDDASIEVSFSGAIDPTRFSSQTCFLVDASGNPSFPLSGALALDGRSATYTFASPLPLCTTFSVFVSNALADINGVLLQSNALPLTLGVIPVAPVIDAHPAVTANNAILLTGSAETGTTIEVESLSALQQVPVTTGTFQVSIPLTADFVDSVAFTSISSCDGARSATTFTTVTQDSSPPTVFIDTPSSGAQLVAGTVDVAGRVGDRLSGFMNLSVDVNGIPADVNVGIGTNGSFLARNVPLLAGNTVLSVTATDGVGNAAGTQISVSQVVASSETATLSIISGNGQDDFVEMELDQPLVVNIVRGVTPFANKLVTFTATRSNGRLSETAGGAGQISVQVRTDAMGNAQAFLRLGTDAGHGNNRVTVTSKDVIGEVVFCASATARPPTQINIGSGNQQRAEAGALTPEPIRVWVNDGCNGAEGIPVTFTVVQGGGAVNGENTATVSTSNTGHATVDFQLGLQPGNNVVEATFPGNAGGPAVFSIVGVNRQETLPTRFSGVVLDNGNQPIQGATCVFTFAGLPLPAVLSDVDGRFSFESLPSGAARLHVDGGTATHLGGTLIDPGTFPSLSFPLVVIPNAENTLPTPVLLPKLNATNSFAYSTSVDTELTVQEIVGLKMTVKAGSMSIGGAPAPDGTVITLNQVHHDDVPMPMPDGAAPPFAWTLQPSGATFDPPVGISYPNMSGLPAGATPPSTTTTVAATGATRSTAFRRSWRTIPSTSSAR